MLWILGGVFGVLLFLFLLGTVTSTIQISVKGITNLTQNTSLSDNNGVQVNPNVVAAQPGSLTTRTNNTAGTITMTNSGHGITTGQRVDLYWSGGQAYNATVGTVSGTSVPIASVGGGSALPSQNTAITVGIPTNVPFNLTGNNLTGLFCSPGTGVSGYFVFNDGSSDNFAVYVPAGFVYNWALNGPVTNPLAGTTPTKVYMSHSNTAAAQTSMQAAALFH